MKTTKLLAGARQEIERLQDKAKELEQVNKEIARLQKVVDLLEDGGSVSSGDVPSTGVITLPERKVRAPKSAEARAKIAAAQRARWAKVRADSAAKEAKSA
jgi:hypothetical protein